jgi:hypothetical protein
VERLVSMGGSLAAGIICSSSLSESSSLGRMSSIPTEVFAGADISGSKSDSSKLSCSSAVWGRSVVVCGAVKSLIAACGFAVVGLWN